MEKMKVTVVGTGYVGLTTGVCLAYVGHEVTCLDHDAKKIEALNAGKCPIYEPHLEEMMAAAKERLRFTTEYAEAVPSAEVVFIAVGTPPMPDGTPDLQYLRGAATAIGKNISSPRVVVVNKSTVPIGSAHWVDTIVRDAYRTRTDSHPDTQFFLASNPEFLREGSAISDTLYADRVVVGAESPVARQMLQDLYRPILEQTFTAPDFLPRPENFTAVPLISATPASAELIKYAANAFLSLKISFINEIGELAQRVGADVTDIAHGIGLDTRIGSRFLQAGLGWGGSCFGKDTSALVSTGKEYSLEMPIVSAARTVNYRQRARVVTTLQDSLKILKGRTIGLLGAAFKPNTDDLRDAPALGIAKLLMERGASIRIHDPIALDRAEQEWKSEGLVFERDLSRFFGELDAIVLVTEWPDYRKIDWDRVRTEVREPILLDGRNYLDAKKIQSLGFTYRTLA